jgi:hypothetical protein
MFLVINQQAEAQLLEKIYLSDGTIRIQTNQGNPLIDVQLIENTDHCFIDCYAILKLHLYQDTLLPKEPNYEFDWEFMKEKSWMDGLVSYHFEILEINEYKVEVPEYGKMLVNTSCYKESNTTYKCEIEQIIQTGSHEETRYSQEYKPFKFWGETLRANQDYTIKLIGKKRAKLGTNNIEWIPKIKGLELNEWEWWNTSWNKCRKITNLSSVDIPSGYQVKITFNNATIPYADFMPGAQDIRFTNGADCNIDGGDLLQAWNETSNTSNTNENLTFWIKLDSANKTTFLMYYNASNVNNVFSAENTFEFQDWLEPVSAINTTKWEIEVYDMGVAEIVNNSLLHVKGDGSWPGAAGVKCKLSFFNFTTSQNLLTEYRFKYVDDEDDRYVILGNETQVIRWMLHAYDGVQPENTLSKRIYNGTEHFIGDNVSVSPNIYYIIGIYINTSAIRWYFNNTLNATHYATQFNTAEFRPHMGVSWPAGAESYTDWVRIRKFVDPEPNWSIGNETFFDTVPPETIPPIIKPDPAYTTDNLLCNATLTDNKATSLTAYWKWYKNGLEHLSGSTNVVNGTNTLVTSLLSGNTTKGESWVCEVAPYDGVNYGSAKNSSSLTITNYVPTHSNPILTSTSGKNFTTDNLTCYNQSTYDPDNEGVVNIYNWYKNDQPISVLNMPFENSATDYSGKGNNGTLKPNATDGPKFVDGKTGKALLFDGKDDYVNLGSDASLKPQDGTYEAWIKMDALPTDTNVGGVIFENYQYYNGLFFSVRNTGKLHIRTHNGAAACTLDSVSTLNAGEWYHVVGITNETNATLYINGVFNGSTTCAYTLPPLNTISRIGSWGSIFFFNGTIDEVKIYPYALTLEQIRQEYLDSKDGYTNSRTIVNQETTPGETYRCEVTPTDGFDDGIALNSTDLAVLWNITFNITNGEDGSQSTNVNIYCNNSWSTTGVNSPYEHGFLPGDYSCTFEASNYYNKTITFAANDDKTVNVILSLMGALTSEEHKWLEWLYNCWRDGNCWNLLNEINQTTTQIWQRLTGTNRNVVIQENVLSYILNATSNITINYTIKVPYKEGVPLSELLPIRLYFWFTDVNRTKCYSQDKANISNRAEAPYCLPLVAEILEPNNGSVTFTVDLRPALPYGTYNFTRSIEIDPFGIWTQYGREDLGAIHVLEYNEEAMISSIKTNEKIMKIEEQRVPSITGDVLETTIKEFFTNNQIFILLLVGMICITIILNSYFKYVKKV